MSKLFKRISLMIATVCITLTAVLSAACTPEPKPNDDDPATEGYKITVLYPDGSPVKAIDSGNARRPVRVMLMNDDETPVFSLDLNGPDAAKIPALELDENGTGFVDYKVPGEYNVFIYNLPAGYGFDPINTTADKSKLTVNLYYLSTSYDVNVTAPDGNPADGYDVKLIQDGKEVAKGKTDAQGKYKFENIDSGEYDVSVSCEGKNYHHKPVTTSMKGEPVNVKMFEPQNVYLDEEHKMSEEVLNEWVNALNSSALTRIDPNADNYIYPFDVYGSEETFFILHAAKSGSYTINMRRDENSKTGNYLVKFYVQDSYGNENTSMRLDGSVDMGNRTQHLSMSSGEKWIISVSSIDHREHYSVNMAISYNKEPATTAAVTEGSYTLTYTDIDEAIFTFSPTVRGEYTLSLESTENSPRYLVYSYATGKPIDDFDPDKSYYENAKEFPYVEIIPESFVGNTFIYHVFIDKTTTTTVRLKVEKTGDANDDTKPVEVPKAQVTAKLVQQEKQSGTWKWLPTDGSVIPFERDGEYFVNVDGKEYKAFTAITKNFYDLTYSFATIEYMGEGNHTPGEDDNNDDESGLQPDKQNSYLTVGSGANAINYDDFVKAYSEKCHPDDGVYALNSELKAFTERYMNQRWTNHFVEVDVKNPPAQPWLIACGYFA